MRIWDPADGSCLTTLQGHDDAVTALCAFSDGNRTLLATGNDDRTVRIWELVSGSAMLVVPVYRPVRALCEASGLLVIASVDGLVAIDLGNAADDHAKSTG